MLARQGAVYHFRRKVPVRLRPLIGQAEIWASLRTSSATIARVRAGRLYAAVEELFEAARMGLEDEILRMRLAVAEEERDIAELERRKAVLQAQTDALRAAMRRAEEAEKMTARVKALGARISAVNTSVTGLIGQHKATRASRDASQKLAETLASSLSEVAQLRQATAAMAPPPPAPKPLASELVEPHLEHRVKVDKKTHQVAGQERYTLRRFLEICGDRPIDAYGRGDINGFLDAMRKMPVATKRKKDRSLTAQELIARAKASGEPLLEEKTVKRHDSALKQFFMFAVNKGHVTLTAKLDATGSHRFRIEGKANEKRDAWSLNELKALFSSPVWAGCKSAYFRAEPGGELIRDARFWIPLLALYHGARLEEFADLYRRDLRLDGVTWAMDIRRSTDHASGHQRRLKTRNAARTIPLHPELIRLGFLDYVRRVAPQSDMPLFPDLERQGKDGKRGPRFTRWFVEYRKSIGIYRPGVGAHAFRHTAITQLTNAVKDFQQKRMRDYMMGHAPNEVVTHPTEGDVTYDKGAGLAWCAETLALLRYPELDLSHLYVPGAAQDA